MTKSVKYKSPLNLLDVSTHGTSVQAGTSDLYTKSDGLYVKKGTTESKLAESSAELDDLVVGSSYIGVETPPTDGAIFEGKVGMGTADPLVALHLFGGIAFKHENKTANYTLTSNDSWISASNAITLTLPEFASGTVQNQLYLLKNANAATNVTVATVGSSTIDGNASITLNGKEAVLVGWGGSNWQILLHFSGSL